MGGEKDADRGAPGADQRDRSIVAALIQAEAAILRGDLHPERADAPQLLDHSLGDLPRPLDLLRVHLPQDRLHLAQELRRAGLHLGIPAGRGIDQRHAQTTQEELAYETGLGPFRFACRLSNRPGLVLRDLRRDGRRAHRYPLA